MKQAQSLDPPTPALWNQMGRGGGGGGGLNGNLPNLLTLLCWMGGTRGTWLRPHSGIIKAQSLDIRHVVQIPPSFTRAWWRPLSQVHKEVQFLLLVLQHFLSPNQQATTVPVNHIRNFPQDAYFENFYISRNGCLARLKLFDPIHFFSSSSSLVQAAQVKSEIINPSKTENGGPNKMKKLWSPSYMLYILGTFSTQLNSHWRRIKQAFFSLEWDSLHLLPSWASFLSMLKMLGNATFCILVFCIFPAC